MEVTYEGEAHHPDLALPVAVEPPPPPAEPLSRSLPLPPRLARSHKLEDEDDEEMKDYEILLDLLDAMDPSSSWDTELTEILDTMKLDHNPRFARSNEQYEPRQQRFKKKRQTSTSTRTQTPKRSWRGASSFANTKMTPFVHHETLSPRTRHPRRVRGHTGWRTPPSYELDDTRYRRHYY